MTPTTQPSGRNRRHRVLVIGGGMAGARLAQQLAGHSGTEVTVLGEEGHAPYNRVLLAEVLAGQYPAEVIALPLPGDGVRWLSGVRAVRIDRAASRVACDDGGFLRYDSLVLATGSNPVLPPLRGLFPADGRPAPGAGELPEGVLPFRTMDDCLALAQAAGPGSRAVVIGGGLLGVSAARALAQRGAQVVLAHQGEHLMERHLDRNASALLRRHMAQLGVEVHTECRVRGLATRAAEGGAGRRAVQAVELADGFRLTADTVVLACGVRPRTGLAQAAGIETARGVVVDDELRTSDPDVFAIGDCAEHDGVLYGLAGAAQEQADALARVLADRAEAGTGGRPDDRTAPRYTGTRALTRLTLAAPPRTAARASGTTGTGDITGTGGTNGTGDTGGANSTNPVDHASSRHPAAAAPPANGPAEAVQLPAVGPYRGAARTAADAPLSPGEDREDRDRDDRGDRGDRGRRDDGARNGSGNSDGARNGNGAPRPDHPGTLDLAAFGETEPQPQDDVVHLSDATRSVYRKVVVRGDRIVGGILLGDLGSVGTLARTWEGDEPLPSAPLLHLLTTDGGS